jgi:hypothetical protein
VLRILVLALAGGCTTMTVRAGMVAYDGKPAFQASLEVGPSVYAKRRGVAMTHEHGIEAGDRTMAITALDLDVLELDDDGPIARVGPRLRTTYTQGGDTTTTIGMRGAAYSGLGRDPKSRSGGLGIELAGGVMVAPHVGSVVEANLVATGRFGSDWSTTNF